MMVLSGMGNMEMMNDNCSYMKNFQPLNEQESAAVGYGTDFRRTCQVGMQKSHSEKSRICPFIACKMQFESQPSHVDHIDL